MAAQYLIVAVADDLLVKDHHRAERSAVTGIQIAARQVDGASQKIQTSVTRVQALLQGDQPLTQAGRSRIAGEGTVGGIEQFSVDAAAERLVAVG